MKTSKGLFNPKRFGLGLVAAGCFASQLAVAVPVWSAATLPADGNISGQAGSTIGWGYQLDNHDTGLWLVLTGLSAGAFAHGVPSAVFDLPILAPGDQVSVAFDGSNGLYGLTWDSDAAVGFVNAGEFLLTAQWYDGDPLAGGVLVESAEAIRLMYSAMVDARPDGEVAEPEALLLLAAGLLGLWGRRRAPTLRG